MSGLSTNALTFFTLSLLYKTQMELPCAAPLQYVESLRFLHKNVLTANLDWLAVDFSESVLDNQTANQKSLESFLD